MAGRDWEATESSHTRSWTALAVTPSIGQNLRVGETEDASGIPGAIAITSSYSVRPIPPLAELVARPCRAFCYSSSISASRSMSIESLTLIAAGHFIICVSRARCALSRMPSGIFRWYFTRIRVMRMTPSTSSMSPSTSLQTLSGCGGILRTARAPDSVPVSQPPTAAIM